MGLAMKSTARFGQMAVDFPTSQDDDSPGTVEFTAVIRLSESDLVAALWRVNVLAEELADLDTVRALVADATVNLGLDAVNDARYLVAGLAPGTAEHAWSQQIHAAMRVDRSRVYRVRAVAEMLDVSRATVYRAVESGQLDAYKIGSGKGTLRISGEALAAYLSGHSQTGSQLFACSVHADQAGAVA